MRSGHGALSPLRTIVPSSVEPGKGWTPELDNEGPVKGTADRGPATITEERHAGTVHVTTDELVAAAKEAADWRARRFGAGAN